ncbi:MAG: Eco57I restriction-modification methylase domain-containing protein, partial [Prevotellaceae bacterium]|nr:Eco57I restriction-modification methylase domain-containing protein [Prevotellaceae bacterium]
MITTNIKSAKQALNPAHLKQKLERAEMELFKKELIALLNRINPQESEEFHKNLMIEFLNAVYYKNKYYINTKGHTDLVIHNDKTPQSSVGVQIEVKSPTNGLEMVNKENLNKKSFQELVLYYLRERKTGKNFELCYLIITNIYEWFVFDAQDFEKLFYQNKTLLNHFEQFQAGKLSGTSTDFFYKEIASPEIQKLQSEIPYTHFDIRDYDKILRNTDREDDRKLIALYKFLSPVHLLKLPFASDNNQLNREFYAELLHILGLEEIKQEGRKLIVRKKEQERDNGSIIENTIERLTIKNKLVNLDIKQYGNDKEEQLFGVALALTITWINRILFLKLLESQILKYHNGDKNYAFLSPEKLFDYDDLDNLFFSVLARRTNERQNDIKAKFAHVPYLNSSLFEITDIEDKTICIDSLLDNIKIGWYPKSVLYKDRDKFIHQTMQPLEYLLRFLDAYDFSSEDSGDILEENKPLISASVLGLIFEKINGYKDGSFFTPPFITMYMCRETLSAAVVQKFNETKSWNCQTIDDVCNHIGKNAAEIKEANTIFNTIRICDPAVGSGHFLVSALNEMLYLKAKLEILADKDGKLLNAYQVEIENDELIVKRNSDFFIYDLKNPESQRVQETLFHEKQTIIENCLFGVDINPNSVKICQLRLWIELLKHAYYRLDTNELETLPNIDINIKCGNSLISRFDLKDKYDNVPGLERKIKETTQKYKEQVYLYKHATDDKATRRRITQKIEEEKAFFYRTKNVKDPDFRKLEEAKGKLTLQTQGTFVEFRTEEWQQKTSELTKTVTDLEKIYNQKVKSCFEWRFEFPEVLDDDGNFQGFDVVIGNPPYIQLQSMGEITDSYKQMNYQVFERTGDIYCLFYERGYQLLKPQGRLCYITSNKWMRAGYGENTRKFLAENTNPEQLIDFAGVKVFEAATVDVNILMFSKDKNRQQTQACVVKKDGIKDLSVFIRQHASVCSFSSDSWVVLSPIEQRIKAKIEAVGTPLKDWDISINYGIKTGFNDAFIISGEKRKELIEQDPKSEEIIRPILRGKDIKRYGYDFADRWLINTHNGIKEKGIKPININDYPAIKRHLDSYWDKIEHRADQGDTPYNLRNCAYMEDFYKQKIVWLTITDTPKFAMDLSKSICLNSIFFITGNEYLYTILAVLNSK